MRNFQSNRKTLALGELLVLSTAVSLWSFEHAAGWFPLVSPVASQPLSGCCITTCMQLLDLLCEYFFLLGYLSSSLLVGKSGCASSSYLLLLVKIFHGSCSFSCVLSFTIQAHLTSHKGWEVCQRPACKDCTSTEKQHNGPLLKQCALLLVAQHDTRSLCHVLTSPLSHWEGSGLNTFCSLSSKSDLKDCEGDEGGMCYSTIATKSLGGNHTRGPSACLRKERG